METEDIKKQQLRVGAVTFTPGFEVPAAKALNVRDTLVAGIKRARAAQEREKFDTGAVRNNAEGKGRFDLLPFEGVQEWAIALEEGAKTYPDKNWELGIPVARCLSSALRHIHQYMAGMTDEAHLRAALWNVGAAVTIEKRALAGKLPKDLLMDTRV